MQHTARIKFMVPIALGGLLAQVACDRQDRMVSHSPQSGSVVAAPPAIRIPNPEPDFSLPADAGYINVKEFGAKGDGVSDDTAALQRVIGQGKGGPEKTIRSIYIPNGTYLVSDTLVWGDKKKDVIGQSRDGVVIKLKDSAPGFQDSQNPKKVLQVEFGHGGQNFNQHLRNLTVDIGKNNPQAIGIGFHTNNGGGVFNVLIRSSDDQRRGQTGLSLDKAWPGPGLIKNVTVEGFDRGIFITHDQYSMTFEHITLLNQRQVGFVNSWNTVAIRDLKSQNRVPAVENRGPMALMSLIDAVLMGGDTKVPALRNHKDGALFARNLQTQGYGIAIANEAGQKQNVTGNTIDEFVSHPAAALYPGAKKSLQLPIEDTPVINTGGPKSWANVTQFGATPNDQRDDGAAIQKAIDSGADAVYLPAGVYRARRSLLVKGKVKRVLGLNATLIFENAQQPVFIVQEGGPGPVALEVESAVGSKESVWVEHASKRTVLLKNGSYRNTVPGGKVFIEDSVGSPLVFDRQKVWARQLNAESGQHNPQIINRGGDLWVLGFKTERDRTSITTAAGGRTEVLGGLLYKNREKRGPVPAFIAEDATMSLVYRNKGVPYRTQILEKHRNASKELRFKDLPASNGRMPLYLGGS
jgi:hypothetical protein